MRVRIVFVASLALSGCFAAHQNADGLTDQQEGLYNYFISQGLSKEDARLAAVSPIARQIFFDDKKCLSYGAKPGSDAYVACRSQLEAGRSKPPVIVQAAPSPTNCTSVALGAGMVSTNCN